MTSNLYAFKTYLDTQQYQWYHMYLDNVSFGFFPTKDMKTPPFPPLLHSVWSGFHGWCVMYLNEWNINFLIFIFRVMGIENWGNFEYKNNHNSKNKIAKIWNMIFLSIQHIPHLSCNFEHFWKKKLFKCWKNPGAGYLFFSKVVNSHERCGVCWIERKINFPIFIFRVMVVYGHFCDVITSIFDEFSR